MCKNTCTYFKKQIANFIVKNDFDYRVPNLDDREEAFALTRLRAQKRRKRAKLAELDELLQEIREEEEEEANGYRDWYFYQKYTRRFFIVEALFSIIIIIVWAYKKTFCLIIVLRLYQQIMKYLLHEDKVI